MPALPIPNSEQPERGKPRLFSDSFAAEAKEVIENGYIFDFLPDFKAS